MKKIYLVKKDPKAANSPENWNVLNGYEFAMFMKTEEGSSRRSNFTKLEACSEDDVTVIIECDPEEIKNSEKARDYTRYRRKRNREIGYITFSYDSFLVDGKYISDEAIADDTVDVESEVLNRMEIEDLILAVSLLPEDDRNVIDEMFLNSQLTEKAYADKHGMSQKGANKRKTKALLKLKKILDEM